MKSLGLLDGDLLKNSTVLDVGAGEGQLAQAIAFCGASEVWAIDAVPKQLWAAAERSPGHPVLRFAIAGADDLPFADESFDIVTGHLVLHHIEPLAPVVKELMRCLRPGGRFVAAEPTPLLGSIVHEHTSANEAPISPRRVMSELQQGGFREIGFKYHWQRLDTTRLGMFSPGYVVWGRKPGSRGKSGPVVLRRTLDEMKLPGLKIDSGCAFATLAREQEAQILKVM